MHEVTTRAGPRGYVGALDFPTGYDARCDQANWPAGQAE
jgi:hypothetical protein